MDHDIAPIAALLADRARVAMLFAVSDGRHLSAGALAQAGQVTPSAASAHLAKLVTSGLLAVERHGRSRYYRLANPAAIAALEALAAIPPASPPDVAVPSPLRLARSCYDHLAGALGVRVTDVLIARGALMLAGREYTVTPSGVTLFADLGVDAVEVADAARRARRPVARPCLDWSERRHHLAGAMGAALATRLLAAGWVARSPTNRVLTITPPGRRGFRRVLDITVDVALR